MKYKKIHDNCYFIKIKNDWYNLIDLFENINSGNLKDKNDMEFTREEIVKIRSMHNNIIEVDSDNSNNLLNDYIEIFESQINELYRNQEEIYAITQSHQNEIEKINRDLE